MAYAALVSLEHTIDDLLNSSDLWIVPRYEAITECKKQVKSLVKVLQRLDRSVKGRSRKTVNGLDRKIKEAASRLEDGFEFYLSDQIVKQSEEHEGRIRFLDDMEHLKQDFRSFTTRMQNVEQECMKELKKMMPEEEMKKLVESVSRFEDVLDFNLSNRMVSVHQSRGRGDGIRIFVDMQCCKLDIELFIVRMKEMEEGYLEGLRDLLPDKELKKLFLKEIQEKEEEEEEEDEENEEEDNDEENEEEEEDEDEENKEEEDEDEENEKEEEEDKDEENEEEEEDEENEEEEDEDEENENEEEDEDDDEERDEEHEEEEEEDDDDDEDEEYAVSSKFDRGRKSKVFGLSKELSKLKAQLTSEHAIKIKIRVFVILGMAGIGKTALANEICKDPDILKYFDYCAWATIGIKTGGCYEGHLYDKRCLLVLDDVWDAEELTDFKDHFRFSENGSAILLTTRLQEVCDDHNSNVTRVLKMQLLNEKDSWDLLREEVFGKAFCPPQLANAGKKIAKNCDGLPLTIVTVARLLSKGPMDAEYWNEAAEEKNSVFKDAYNEMFKVLYPSYKYLPQHIKPCFLYMGLFPVKYKIPRSRLINMWAAEGFLEQDNMPTIEEWGLKCLEGLLSNNVAMLYQYSSVESRLFERIKTCGLHASFWHLCNREASKSNFFYALHKLEDCMKDGIESQRRLCFRNNVLFGIQKDACDLIGDERAPSTRSLLCYGPYHQYQVPIWFGLRLLRVIDALNIRFYEFPIQVLKLVLLKYFALTFNGDLPPSISKLRKLQYFIVRRHLSIKSCKAPSYLPMEIWDMDELKHLEVMGSDLQAPNRRGTLLPNLRTLLGVSGRSCSKDILGRISNLHKLGVQIVLGLDANEPLRWFDHISHFRGLGSLKCVIVYPEFKVVAPPPPPSVFPWGLKKLTLSGFGYSWEDMGAIASFRVLEVLKLQCYAFRGPKWEIQEGEFPRLSSLVIEDTDLVQLRMRRRSLPQVVNLSLKHCYKLKEIHWEHDKYFRPKIELEDCNPLAVACVKQIVEAASGDAHSVPHVDVHSSYMD